MNILYVLSKDTGDGRILIGKLYKLPNNEFKFEYCFKGHDDFPKWYLRLEEFPAINKIYTGVEVMPFITRLIPKRTSRFTYVLLNKYGLKDYDPWELLKALGKVNAREDAYLFEELPKDTVVYE